MCSKTLEQEQQDEADFTVAHEIAHIVLGHYRPGATSLETEKAGAIQRRQDVPNEIEADKLAESWGFRKPPDSKTMRPQSYAE